MKTVTKIDERTLVALYSVIYQDNFYFFAENAGKGIFNFFQKISLMEITI